MRITITPRGQIFQNKISEDKMNESLYIQHNLSKDKEKEGTPLTKLQSIGIFYKLNQRYTRESRDKHLNLINEHEIQSTKKNQGIKIIKVQSPEIPLSKNSRVKEISNLPYIPLNTKTINQNELLNNTNYYYFSRMVSRLNKTEMKKKLFDNPDDAEIILDKLVRQYNQIKHKHLLKELEYDNQSQKLSTIYQEKIHNKDKEIETIKSRYSSEIYFKLLNRHKMNIEWRNNMIRELQRKNYSLFWSQKNIQRLSLPKQVKEKYLDVIKRKSVAFKSTKNINYKDD